MSRHEGVSCDSCLKGNFPGRRYKCLTCYDYDLCASCYEAGATNTRHTTEHPMQCILTRTDFELYYGGEALSTEQSQSFTCPFCGKMGFTETALQEHVNADHPDSTVEVVCPICAALPGGDPNLVTEDFAGHLALEHRPTPRDLISFLDEPAGSRHNVRRIPHSTRGIGGSRPRRSNMHFSSTGGISSLSPSGRDAVDPIAELLSQLSVVRRTNPTQGSASAQLQQLQMQLQLERQQVRAARQQLERFPRRQVHATTATAATSGTTSTTVTSLSNHVLAVSNAGGGSATPKTSETAGNSNASAHAQPHSQLMLTKCMDTSLSEAELEASEIERADRSIFTQDALLNTLMAHDDDDDADKYETKPAVRERASPIQMPSQSPPQPSSSSSSAQQHSAPQQPSAVTQSSTAATCAAERPKNGQNEPQQPPHQHSVAASSAKQQRAQQRTSPQTTTTTSNSNATTTTSGSSQQQMLQQQQQQQQRTIAQQQQQQPPNRIEYVLSPRPHQSPTGGTISVREVLVGANYAGSDTARRKPICTVDTLTQTTEPPTSH